jgi:hypothetical protein
VGGFTAFFYDKNGNILANLPATTYAVDAKVDGCLGFCPFDASLTENDRNDRLVYNLGKQIYENTKSIEIVLEHAHGDSWEKFKTSVDNLLYVGKQMAQLCKEVECHKWVGTSSTSGQ